jgi:hypothetical protein
MSAAMTLLGSDRWEQVKEAHRLWWARQNDRPMVWVAAPLPAGDEDNAGFGDPPAADDVETEDLARLWSDPAIVIPRAERHMARTYYAGMAHPRYWPDLGPSIASAYLGCPLRFAPDTTWQEPIVRDWDAFMARLDGLYTYADGKVTFTDHEGQRWWQATLDLIRAAVASSRGRYIVGVTDIGGSFDIISHLRKPEPLCVDMIDSPDVLVTLRDWVTDLWFKLYKQQMDMIAGHQEGSSSWIGLWGPGTSYPLQCDFSCMVSPPMFEKYILPEIYDYARGLDNAIYHLDGVDAFVHLDALLSIPEIDAIQWVPGEGKPSAVHWMPLLKKVQQAGKGQFIFAESPEEVRVLIENLRPEGLLIVAWRPTPADADAIASLADQ